MTLMCSWAVVCDVWYLEPQRIQPGENGIAFSNRVKKLIADKAGLRNVSYDGYLKHFEVKQSLVQKQQKMYADVLSKRLTAQELAQIEAERQREREAQAAAAQAAANANAMVLSSVSPTASAVSGPDSLMLSPSPDAPRGSVVISAPISTAAAPNAAASGSSSASTASAASQSLSPSSAHKLRASTEPKGSLGGLTAVSSAANLIELLNQKQEDERRERAAAQAQELRQRK